MQAFLKVVGGKNDGREIKINVPEFIIGRGETAHLRPASDLVSRQHCAIRLKDGKVEIEDLGSRNGSFVNDEQLKEVHLAKSGDRLRIGRLNFEVVIDPVKPGNKKPKVKDVADAAVRTAKQPKPSNNDNFDESITDWLSEPDDTPLNGSFESSETVQFSLEDLEALVGNSDSPIQKQEKATEATTDGDDESDDEADEEADGDDKKSKKKKYGKLPPLPKFSHEDSTEAAGEVLKKFFNRR